MNTCIESIWNEFNKPLRAFIKRRVDNEHDVDDILQNVFYKIHNNMDSLKETDKIHAWIYRITRNTIIDFYRLQKNKDSNIELSEDMILETEEELTANGEIAQCLKTMINYLPEKYKQAIILTEFENLTQKELSERMGLSVSGAKSRVQRARALLKDMLLNCCHLEFDRLGNIVEYQNKSDDCKFC